MARKPKELWGDIRTAPREFMAVAFAQQRERMVGELFQIRMQVDSYNENRNADGEPIVFIFDFTDDMAELEALRVSKQAEAQREA